MCRYQLRGIGKWVVVVCAAAFLPTLARAGDDDPDLRKLVEEQSRQIQELKARLDAQGAVPLADKTADGGAPATDARAVQQIVSDYLKDHPGAGMPTGVQTGWSTGKGFSISSAPNPTYTNWQDESKIPFELRIRGRIQADYYYYKVTDNMNHNSQRLTFPTATTPGNPTGIVGANSTGDFSQFEMSRVRLIFEGNMFTPDLRYQIQIDGNTRGIAALGGGDGLQGVGTGGLATQNGAVPIGNTAATVDHAVRLYGAWIAYDWHPCCSSAGCGCDCSDGSTKYGPTVSFVVGKMKPFFSFEEVLGAANQQFVQYGMSEWFFDADDDNFQTQAGIEAKALEDRFFLHATLNNNNESQTANLQNERMPALNIGGWYDFGGTWNADRKKWDLYGDCIADIDYSCKPVLRVGAATYLAPQDRRSQYSNADIGRIRASSAAPGGTTMITELGGATVGGVAGTDPVDKFDEYSYEAFWGFKYRGFSLFNDWWVRNLDNFKGAHTPGGNTAPILYGSFINTNTAVTSLFPSNIGMIDYGMSLQAGYFIVPKHWEVAARWDFIRGQSGNINGNNTFSTTTLPGVGAVRVVNEAFHEYHESDEYGIALNYYWKRQLLKWQTDLSFYRGGNPSGGGQNVGGFVSGVDGWLLRTQIQLAF